MEPEQIVKKVDWLDDERRKDKDRISKLEERLQALENTVSPVDGKIKDLVTELARLNAQFTRLNAYDEGILQIRVDMKQKLEELEKQSRRRFEDQEKLLRGEIRAVEASLFEARKDLEQLPDLRRALKARMDEESRLARLIDEMRNRIDAVRHDEEEYTRTLKLIEDGRRQDTKRLTDLQGEVAALRKRQDDQFGKIELASASIRKVETHVNELATVETERRQTMTTFLDSQALREVERDRVWKEWQLRFQQIESQASDIEAMLQTLDNTDRSVKRTQQAVEEAAQKAERRINEITEIQRLAEERVRQEWVTFKADDQKRWTNYTLTLEEQRGETQRQYEKLAEKVTQLEDVMQEVQDLLQQMNEGSEKRLQTLLALAHEWVTSFERTIGRSR